MRHRTPGEVFGDNGSADRFVNEYDVVGEPDGLLDAGATIVQGVAAGEFSVERLME